MEELERQSLIPFGGFKELLNLDNDSTLNGHLDKLANTGLIRKSTNVNAWELTKQGSKLLNLVESLKGESREVVGPVVNVIVSGVVSPISFSEVENSLRSRRALQTIARTRDSLSVRLDDPGADATMEIRAGGHFTINGKIPLTSVLSLTNAGDLRRVEEQFINFFNLVPEEARDQPKTRTQGHAKVQSWILMANSLVWSLLYFLFSSAVRTDSRSNITSLRYWAAME
jgi:hypothetical protein